MHRIATNSESNRWKFCETCEFCAEFSGNRRSRFQEIYGSYASSRIVAQTAHFVAIPTLGQLFDDSLLILPTRHIEACSHLPVDLRDELSCLAYHLLDTLRSTGSPIFFEHGAVERTAGGCGLYHAHLHLVPLPRPVEPFEIFHEASTEVDLLRTTLDVLGQSDHYLLMGNDDRVLCRNIAREGGVFPSQFFRQRLARIFHVDRPWDWRKVEQPEVGVLKTIQRFSAEPCFSAAKL